MTTDISETSGKGKMKRLNLKETKLSKSEKKPEFDRELRATTDLIAGKSFGFFTGKKRRLLR